MYTTRITRTLEENPGARKVRTAVFMEEQGYKNEFDDHDADAVHLCIYDGEEGIATARSYQKPELSAQLHAMKMYEALGYKEEGDLIYDEGQPHKMMRKFL